jgi:hypothetical protein
MQDSDLKSNCCGAPSRHDRVCGFCWEECRNVPLWEYEMDKTDPIYSYAPSQKDITRWVKKVAGLD